MADIQFEQSEKLKKSNYFKYKIHIILHGMYNYSMQYLEHHPIWIRWLSSIFVFFVIWKIVYVNFYHPIEDLDPDRIFMHKKKMEYNNEIFRDFQPSMARAQARSPNRSILKVKMKNMDIENGEEDENMSLFWKIIFSMPGMNRSRAAGDQTFPFGIEEEMAKLRAEEKLEMSEGEKENNI